MKHYDAKKRIKQSHLLGIMSAIAAAAMFMAITAGAWFSHRRNLAIITPITDPYQFSIRAGNAEEIFNLDLSEIDVEKVDDTTKKGSKKYVFCVCGKYYVTNYVIQLAHTTNIPFNYILYKADEGTPIPEDNQNLEFYCTYKGKDCEYGYKIDTTTSNKGVDKDTGKIKGGYLNLKSQSSDGYSKLADETYHTSTYDTYSSVQRNAEPLYWQSDLIDQTRKKDDPPYSDDYFFVDFYILEIEWGDGLKNDKETDMIYITAGEKT